MARQTLCYAHKVITYSAMSGYACVQCCYVCSRMTGCSTFWPVYRLLCAHHRNDFNQYIFGNKAARWYGRWGHTLAEGAPGRGMGSRSVLHSLHTGVLLHDASYMCPLHLSGPPQAIQALFACFGYASHPFLSILSLFVQHVSPDCNHRVKILPAQDHDC